MAGSVAVVGGGVAGLAAALAAQRHGARVIVYEASDRVGGRVQTSSFAGLDAIDEGADAFLARVPDAVALAEGLGVPLTHPEAVGAAVWRDRLHDIPEGLLLGVPGKLGPLARTGLLSWRGKARAAIEPLLASTSLDDDSIGGFVRARFGDEVHEYLVDALLGSIYATDTDRFSLAEVPQLHALATRHRSLLLGARATRSAAGTATAAAGAIFAAPTGGVGSLAHAMVAEIERAGGVVRLATPLDGPLRHADGGWDVGGDHADAVVLATPAATAATALGAAAPDAAATLGRAETADVVLVTLHVAAEQWPARLAGRSGYLVPKPAQRHVTAVSFGSQKWAHWQPPAGGQILRVSLGRDGQPVLHLSDDEIVRYVIDDLEMHLGVRISPVEVRVSRWPGAFAQYRPHHARWLDEVEAALPDGVFVAGAAYRGIGIPACVRRGSTIGEHAARFAAGLEE